jgi:hypothetical protein
MNLGPPPTDADKQETPVVKELRLLAFERMADKLEHPPPQKKCQRIRPQAVNKDAGEKQDKRNQNRRYPKGVADAVYRVLMARGILRHPLFVATAAQHGESMIHPEPEPGSPMLG